MPPRSKDGIPGTIYAKGGYLYVRDVAGVVIATTLRDTPANRRLCQTIKRERFVASLMAPHVGPVQKAPPTYGEAYAAWEADTPTMHPVTRKHYRLAVQVVGRGRLGDMCHDPRAVALKWLAEPIGLSGERVSATSQATYIRGWRAFARWIGKRYGVAVDMSGLEPRRQWVEPEYVTASEIATVSGHYAWLWRFMWLTGARPVDVLGLTPDRLLHDKQGVLWFNKITKQPEPRPVCTEAWRIITRHTPPLYRQKRLVARSWEREGIGKPLKALRTGFLRRIDPLPAHMQVWLMRHSTGTVTERHYRVYDWGEVVRLLDGL